MYKKISDANMMIFAITQIEIYSWCFYIFFTYLKSMYSQNRHIFFFLVVNYIFLTFNFYFLLSIFIRKMYRIRENFRILVFNWFTRFKCVRDSEKHDFTKCLFESLIQGFLSKFVFSRWRELRLYIFWCKSLNRWCFDTEFFLIFAIALS